jgi:hypothetical protein
MVVTTEGIEKNWLSLWAEMLDSGAPAWVDGGEMELLTADGRDGSEEGAGCGVALELVDAM